MRNLNPDLRAHVNALLDSYIVRFYAELPAARHLHQAASVDLQLFTAHTTQTILRIRLARMADARAILLFAKSDPATAQKWAKYEEEEMLHDRLFLKDLQKLGVDAATVYGTEPFLATKLLQGYLYYTLEHEGPMGLIAKAYFLEYTSRATQGEWNANVRRSLGADAVRGADAHLNIDVGEDHASDVWNVLMTLVKTPADEARLLAHLEHLFGLFGAYFDELARHARAPLTTGPAQPALAVVRAAAGAATAASGAEPGQA